jgi:hypothetical protein
MGFEVYKANHTLPSEGAYFFVETRAPLNLSLSVTIGKFVGAGLYGDWGSD